MTTSTGTTNARTMNESVRSLARTDPDATAFIAPGESLTWAELDAAADRCAGFLARHGIGPGSRVAWLGRNTLAYPVLLLATRRRRAALAGLNWRLAADELAATASHVQPSLVVTDRDNASALVIDGVRTVTVASVATAPWNDEPIDPTADLSSAPTDAGEIALIWFTSGSTGVPKAVALGAGRIELAIAAPAAFDIESSARLLVVPPVFHVAGSMWVQYGFSRGATVVFTDDATAPGLVRALTEHRITHALMVPTLLRMVVDQLRTDTDDVTDALCLEWIAYGTSPIGVPLLREAIDVFGCRFSQVYGLTEAGGVVCYLGHDDHASTGPTAHRLASTGKPLPGLGIDVRTVLGDEVCGPGVAGELEVRTPTAMLGYLTDGDHLAGGPDPDGWIATGDLAHLDADGYVYIEGRIDDMIITGGENVQPAQVEAVIATMPGVDDCAVYGVPDDTWGQCVRAAVVGDDVDPAAVIAFCRERLAHYKCPAVVDIIDELPRSATGKVIRGRLRSGVS